MQSAAERRNDGFIAFCFALDYRCNRSMFCWARCDNTPLSPAGQLGLPSVTGAIQPRGLMEALMAKKTNTDKTVAPSDNPESKQDLVLSLLRRQDGASIAEICEATVWQPHSVRGFMSGALKKRLKIEVISEKNEAGERRYFVAPLKTGE